MKKRGLVALLTLAITISAGTLPVYADTTPAAQTTAQDTANDTEQETRFALAPSGISKNKKGRMYIADRSYHVVRVRATDGTYQILAGKEGESGYKNGSAEKARFHAPWDVVYYRNGWLISDTENHALRLYKNGKVTTIAGNGTAGYKNAAGKHARFNRPTGMAVGKNGEVYISDTGNHVIRKIDKNGKVTTYAGGKKGCADGTLKKARFTEPTGLYYYKGVLYVADSGNHRICKIENGKVTTVAGSAKGIEGDKNASALKARFSNPQDIFLYKDVMYISDTANGCVKQLKNGKVTTLIEAFSMDDQRMPAEPCGLTVQGKKLYVGDMFTEEFIEWKL